jgi:opacity protein-like surface antigen
MEYLLQAGLPVSGEWSGFRVVADIGFHEEGDMVRTGGKRLLAVGMFVLLPACACAAESGFFGGIDVSASRMHGSSDTRDGGAAFAGGGVVGNVKFGNAAGIGGEFGYRFDSPWSASIGYQHVRGRIGWEADFPMFDIASRFAGHATGNAIMANVAREFPLSDAVAIRAFAGMGITYNTLSDVVETDVGTEAFLSDVGRHTRTGPVARLGLGIQYRLTRKMLLGLDASYVHAGGFRTADTRSGNLGVTEIVPYRIDRAKRTDLAVSLRRDF